VKAIWVRAITFLVFASLAAAAPAVVLVVRHAERAAAPADDPPLTAIGKQRAEELARVVQAWSAAGAPVSALFASEVRRTQQTLEPTAAATHVKVSVVAAKDTPALAKAILAIEGGVVVVAGHSNTIPAIVQALGGPAGIVIADADFDRLFVITSPGAKAQVVTLRYGGSSDPANASHMRIAQSPLNSRPQRICDGCNSTGAFVSAAEK
jgi:phosphohistidine phosphatase SixA